MITPNPADDAMSDFFEPIEPKLFRKTLSMLTTGVTVIITQADGETHGMTANAVTSLSLDPMMILICVGKKSKMAACLKSSHRFTINVLRKEQEAISNHFAGVKTGDPPKFRLVPWDEAIRLEGCLSALSCEVADILEGGDHWIVTGRVTAIHHGIEPHKPLIVYNGSYRQLTPEVLAPAPKRWDMMKKMPQIFYDPWEN